MDVLMLLQRRFGILSQSRNPLFTFSVVKQKEYLRSFPDPKDDIERSYFQYKCQMLLAGVIESSLWRFAAFFLVPIYLIRFSKHRNYAVRRTDAVFLADGKDFSIIPNILRQEFLNIAVEANNEQKYLTLRDRHFLSLIWRRYPFSFLFLLKLILKIARYRGIIDNYKPTALLVCNEYSYTSSALRLYCENLEVELINVMHGEKLFSIRDSFFHFDRCYIWDDSYEELFDKLRALNTYFAIIPESLRFSKKLESLAKFDYTYYLQSETEEQLLHIEGALSSLKRKGASIKIRKHPRYSNSHMVNRIFENFFIEDLYSVSLENSLLDSKSAISQYSTVLFQAYLNGVSVVIDDLVEPFKFRKLEELDYAMLRKEHKLLSEIINN